MLLSKHTPDSVPSCLRTHHPRSKFGFGAKCVCGEKGEKRGAPSDDFAC